MTVLSDPRVFVTRAKTATKSFSYQKAITSLGQNQSLTILPADNGRFRAVLNTSDYQDKISTLLNDTTTYSMRCWRGNQRIQKRSHPTTWKRPSYQLFILPQIILRGSRSVLVWTSQNPQNRNTPQTHRQQHKLCDIYYRRTFCWYFTSQRTPWTLQTKWNI